MKRPVRRLRSPSVPVVDRRRCREGEALGGAGRAVGADRANAAKAAATLPYPGRKPLDDRLVLQGILFVLYTGIGWEHLLQELGFGCGMTAWRRLCAWQQAGVWERLHEVLLAELQAADQLEWTRAIADSSHVQAKKGAPRLGPARSIARVDPRLPHPSSWLPDSGSARGRGTTSSPPSVPTGMTSPRSRCPVSSRQMPTVPRSRCPTTSTPFARR
jgi:transposase